MVASTDPSLNERNMIGPAFAPGPPKPGTAVSGDGPLHASGDEDGADTVPVQLAASSARPSNAFRMSALQHLLVHGSAHRLSHFR